MGPRWPAGERSRHQRATNSARGVVSTHQPLPLQILITNLQIECVPVPAKGIFLCHSARMLFACTLLTGSNQRTDRSVVVLSQLHLSVKGTALVCATSWWNTAEISAYLGQTQKPIWVNLSQNRTELYREITNVYCGHSKDLERCALVSACPSKNHLHPPCYCGCRPASICCL